MRTDLYRSALHIAAERPIFGWGYGQFGYQFIKRLNTDMSMRVGAWGADLQRAIDRGQEQVYNIGTHNLYLEIQVEYGLLGLIPFLGFLYLVLNDYRLGMSIGDEDLRNLSIYLFAGTIAFLACGMLGHAKMLKILWILAGLGVAVRRLAILGDTETNPYGRYAARPEPQGS